MKQSSCLVFVYVGGYRWWEKFLFYWTYLCAAFHCKKLWRPCSVLDHIIKTRKFKPLPWRTERSRSTSERGQLSIMYLFLSSHISCIRSKNHKLPCKPLFSDWHSLILILWKFVATLSRGCRFLKQTILWRGCTRNIRIWAMCLLCQKKIRQIEIWNIKYFQTEL